MKNDELEPFKNLDFLRKAVCTPNGRAFLKQTLDVIQNLISKLEIDIEDFRAAEVSLLTTLKNGDFFNPESPGKPN